ncbi:hypothetical protein ACL1G3_00265 [Corynebacterium striatum]
MTARKAAQANTEKLDAKVAKLHAAGNSQGAIAEELGVSRWAVRKSAERLGLTWDTTRTAKAVEAAAHYAKAERVQLMQRWTDIANDELDRAEAEPDFMQRRNSIEAAATATANVARLARVTREDHQDEDDDPIDEINKMLDMMGA